MKKSLVPLVERMLSFRGSEVQLNREHLWHAIIGAIDGHRLVNNLAEALRISAAETEQLLVEEGFGNVVAQSKVESASRAPDEDSKQGFVIDPYEGSVSPFPEYFEVEFSPPLTKQVDLSASQQEAVALLQGSTLPDVSDSFVSLFRSEVLAYHDRFIAHEGKTISAFLEEHFGADAARLLYLVNSGIGANEQFNHFVADINNTAPGRRLEWFIVRSSKHLHSLPASASLDNTLFMEFSRSGKTEETVKIHESTAAQAVRIVFANSGPLRALGERDANTNLVLDLPDQVSGRFGRNKTPILLAPMYVAGLDTRRFWLTIERAISTMDLSSRASLPARLATFIFIHQLRAGVNQIYLGCDDDILANSADEFVQFWNEGVNKNGNDIMMSRYFGLLRDSHANIEGILGNSSNKLAIFLLSNDDRYKTLPPFAHANVDPINPDHVGLRFGDEERVLALANYEHMSKVMPCVKIQLSTPPSLDLAAVLGQLWADVTFFYSRLKDVDPGSNPEVKNVRDRAAALLTAEAARRRNDFAKSAG